MLGVASLADKKAKQDPSEWTITAEESGKPVVKSSPLTQPQTVQPAYSREQSTLETTQSSFYQSFLSTQSLSVSSTSDNEDEKNQAKPHPCQSFRKRPRFSDLQQHQSTSKLISEDIPAQSECQKNRFNTRRRCVSADGSFRRPTSFNSPDRYLGQRPDNLFENTSFRINKPPSALSSRERYERQRDNNLSPFRSFSSSRSRSAVRQRSVDPRARPNPPYYIPSFVHGLNVTTSPVDLTVSTESLRQISAGAIWTVGGRSTAQGGQIYAIPDGNGNLLASGSTAPMHVAHFLDKESLDDQLRGHESRLAHALDLDQASRVLHTSLAQLKTEEKVSSPISLVKWQNSSWVGGKDADYSGTTSRPRDKSPAKAVPSLPFRVLDAPNMKDDYYCSILAYSESCRTLAVALTNKVYLWTEHTGVHYPPFPPARAANFVTSLSFSSAEGGKAILAISRHSGRISLWSLFENDVRFEVSHPNPASCLCFKPSVTYRPGGGLSEPIAYEDLLVADDSGHVYYYAIDWPEPGSFHPGSMTMLVKLDAHAQNICGLAWSPEGKHFATGGNDNAALLFEVAKVLQYANEERRGRTRERSPRLSGEARLRAISSLLSEQTSQPIPAEGLGLIHPSPTQVSTDRQPDDHQALHRPHFMVRSDNMRPSRVPYSNPLPPGVPGLENLHTHSFHHSAAVKALAFAPWQPSLLATGGGSNDRQIHFHHTGTGTTLAVINVFAQVTSLVWSKTRREIASTFGYAQPEHDTRIAVFAWPSCECVVSIPWERKQNGEFPRALWAIPYPGGPNDATTARPRRPTGIVTEEDERFRAWDPTRMQDSIEQGRGRGGSRIQDNPRHGGIDEDRHDPNSTRESSRETRNRNGARANHRRGEGETWASRTEEEGSLIIACCDETVKFFEIWAGHSKGKNGRGLGNIGGVLGGSRILEGWADHSDEWGADVEVSSAAVVGGSSGWRYGVGTDVIR